MPWIDTVLFHALNTGAGNRALDALFPNLTSLHQRPWVLVALAVYCAAVLWRGSRRARVWVLCALLAVGLSDLSAARVVKRLAPRDRPCHQSVAGGAHAVLDVRLVPGARCPGSKSFPSNHAANMMALGAVCWWMTRRRSRWSFCWFLLPTVIGYTRIYLGFHYPSDVAGGWLLGAAIAAMVLWIACRLPAARPAFEE